MQTQAEFRLWSRSHADLTWGLWTPEWGRVLLQASDGSFRSPFCHSLFYCLIICGGARTSHRAWPKWEWCTVLQLLPCVLLFRAAQVKPWPAGRDGVDIGSFAGWRATQSFSDPLALSMIRG